MTVPVTIAVTCRHDQVTQRHEESGSDLLRHDGRSDDSATATAQR
ncbi:hypothetical protein BLSMQ_1087 [Brevibacterium aurantiacum]|uniref:Uncharacterized protein n=1 Tax=Brevibacterium aurantiacum TaxID=273384 RepID=A0A1D7W158_BREAU|nr:hypothetical protein BLSMQ_1087 [Brevibacterium aurantiacum]